MSLFLDPAFLIAVAAWLLLLLGAFALCVVAARGDREFRRKSARLRAMRDVADRRERRVFSVDGCEEWPDVIDLPPIREDGMRMERSWWGPH